MTISAAKLITRFVHCFIQFSNHSCIISVIGLKTWLWVASQIVTMCGLGGRIFVVTFSVTIVIGVVPTGIRTTIGIAIRFRIRIIRFTSVRLGIRGIILTFVLYLVDRLCMWVGIMRGFVLSKKKMIEIIMDLRNKLLLMTFFIANYMILLTLCAPN